MPQRLNWTLILLLSIVGDAMGLRAVFNFIPGSEPFLWLASGLLTALIIGRKAPGKFFLHGFVVGVLWGVFSAMIEVLYFELFLANNPDYVEAFNTVTAVSPTVYLMLCGTAGGIVAGLILGGLSWLLRKRDAAVSS